VDHLRLVRYDVQWRRGVACHVDMTVAWPSSPPPRRRPVVIKGCIPRVHSRQRQAVISRVEGGERHEKHSEHQEVGPA
jgi:hypothetical protein